MQGLGFEACHYQHFTTVVNINCGEKCLIFILKNERCLMNIYYLGLLYGRINKQLQNVLFIVVGKKAYGLGAKEQRLVNLTLLKNGLDGVWEHVFFV